MSIHSVPGTVKNIIPKKKVYIFSSSPLHHTCHFFGVLLTINCHGLIEGREKMSKSF